MARRVEVDFVCVGGGLGGLAGAAFARLGSMSCAVLEKSDLIGGVGAYSGGLIWAPNNHLMDDADSDDDALAYLSYLGGGQQDLPHDEALRRCYVQHLARVVRIATQELGVCFQLTGTSDQYFPQAPGSRPRGRAVEVTVERAALGELAERIRRTPYCQVSTTHLEDTEQLVGGRQVAILDKHGDLGPLPARIGKGMGLVGGFLHAAVVQRGAQYLLSTAASRLVFDGDRVVGVIATDVAGELEIVASRGVLLASGGYGYAPYAAMMEGLPSLHEQAPPVVEGDTIRLTDPTSAALVRAGNCVVCVGFLSKTLTHPGTDVPLYLPLQESLGLPHCIVVNSQSRRFGDESFYGAFAAAVTRFDGNTKTFPNCPPYLITDDQFRQKYGGISSLGYWPEDDLVQAPTIAALAEQLGLPSEHLVDAVDSFNDGARQGVDRQFGRGSFSIAATHYGDKGASNPNVGPLDTPPFWGVRLELLGTGHNSHGLRISPHAEVLTRDGAPIPGLYATGNAVAYAELPFGYESGFANGRNVLYAARAAEHAARSSR